MTRCWVPKPKEGYHFAHEKAQGATSGVETLLFATAVVRSSSAPLLQQGVGKQSVPPTGERMTSDVDYDRRRGPRCRPTLTVALRMGRFGRPASWLAGSRPL